MDTNSLEFPNQTKSHPDFITFRTSNKFLNIAHGQTCFSLLHESSWCSSTRDESFDKEQQLVVETQTELYGGS